MQKSRSFDWLRTGDAWPAMMSVGLHCPMSGRPGRIGAIANFLDYVQEFGDVWICRRVDIREHWRKRHPYRPWSMPKPACFVVPALGDPS